MNSFRRAFTAFTLAAVAVVSTTAPVSFGSAAQAQSQALRHVLRYKRPVATGGCPTANSLLSINPANLSTLFQAIAGTGAVTTDGDVVGTANDANGNGFNLTSTADTGVRPTYETAGGLHWLEYDGDALLRRTSALMYPNGAVTIGLAIRHANTATQGSVVAEGRGASSTPRYNPTRNVSGDYNDVMAVYTGDDNVPVINNYVLNDEGYGDGTTDITLIITDSTTSMRGFVDGVGGTATSYTRGTTTLDRFSLGARVRATNDDFFIGRIYRVEIYNYVMDATQIAALDTCLRATQGR